MITNSIKLIDRKIILYPKGQLSSGLFFIYFPMIKNIMKIGINIYLQSPVIKHFLCDWQTQVESFLLFFFQIALNKLEIYNLNFHFCYKNYRFVVFHARSKRCDSRRGPLGPVPARVAELVRKSHHGLERKGHQEEHGWVLVSRRLTLSTAPPRAEK